jgi:hypothetical protein
MREAGKGSRQRPTNYQSFSEQMEIIFGKKKNDSNECIPSGLREDTHAPHTELAQDGGGTGIERQDQRG